MKKFQFISIVLLASCIYGCIEEKELGPIDNDGVAPASVTVKEVISGPGMATIKYDLPDDNDLLFVKANYAVGEKLFESTSSYFNKTIDVEGFNEVKDYNVELTCVDRSGNVGDPISVTVSPKEAPVFTIFKSLKIRADWGGANYAWKNDHNAPVVVHLLATDSLDNLETIEWVYTQVDTVNTTERGFEPVEQVFGAFVKDKFDNYSDTIIASITPFFEEQIACDENNEITLSNDVPYVSWSGPLREFFDDDQNTYVAYSGTFPHIFSFDLGSVVKLSRFKLWNRISRDVHYYGLGNAEKFRLFGAAELPESDDLSAWTLLGTYHIKKPSGLPIGASLTGADKLFVDQGFENLVPLVAPDVRYVRIAIDKTFGNTDYSYHANLKFFGRYQ